MATPAELFQRQRELAGLFAELPDEPEFDRLVPIARLLAARLRDLVGSQPLWGEIERSRAWPPATDTQLRLLCSVDWDVVLSAMGYVGPPPAAEYGYRIAAAVTVSPSFAFQHDHVNLLRDRLQELSHQLDRDAVQPRPGEPGFLDRFRARIGLGRRAVTNLEWVEIGRSGAADAIGKGDAVWKAAALGAITVAHPGASIATVLGHTLAGLAKQVLLAFGEALDKVHEEDVERGRAARSAWVDECLVDLDELVRPGRIGHVASQLEFLLTLVNTSDGAGFLPEPLDVLAHDEAKQALAECREWLAHATSSLVVLWDILGAVWGAPGGKLVERVVAPLSAVAEDLALIVEAVEVRKTSDVRERLRSARACFKEGQAALASVVGELVNHRLALLTAYIDSGQGRGTARSSHVVERAAGRQGFTCGNQSGPGDRLG